MLPEGVLTPITSASTREVRTGPPAGRGKGLSYVLWVFKQLKRMFAGANLFDITGVT